MKDLVKEVNVDGLDKRVEENLESLVDRWERFMKKEKVVHQTEVRNEEKDELLESDDYDDDIGA